MLFRLTLQQQRIERGEIDEAAVYRDPATRRLKPRRTPPAGILECPICGLTAAAFLRFGLAGRRNALCPRCGSVERHRMLWLFLCRRTNLGRRRPRVLHTAPEPALAGVLRARHGRRYLTLDRYDPAADVNADLTRLPFPDARFDVILSSHVLEHIPDDRAAMAELARVLHPAGWAVIMVPYDPDRPTLEDAADTTPASRMAAYGHPFHYRIYGWDLTERLATAGLRAVTISAQRWLSAHQRRRYRLNKTYLLFCTKLRSDHDRQRTAATA